MQVAMAAAFAAAAAAAAVYIVMCINHLSWYKVQKAVSDCETLVSSVETSSILYTVATSH